MEQSDFTVGQSTAAQREEKLQRLRFVYLLFAAQLGAAVAAASLALCCGEALGGKLAAPAAVAGAACLGVLLLIYFLPMVRSPPLSWGLYLVFAAAFAVVAAWAAARDPTRLAFFWLWAVFGSAGALSAFFLVAAFYPSTLAGLLAVVGGAAPALVGFLALGEAEPWQAALTFLAATVFAFYLAYQHRAAVRNSLWDFEREEAVSGSVRLWLDGLLGLGRTAELFCRPLSAPY